MAKTSMAKTSKAKESKKMGLNKKAGIRLFITVIPLLALIFVFSYLPLYGWVYALFDYKPGRPLLSCEFLGLRNFTRMFGDIYYLEDLLRVMKNTLGMSFLSMAGSMLPMFFAIFLTEIKCMPYRKICQTVTTIPNFISWVLVYSVAYSMLSVNDGMINRLLIRLDVIDEGINFLASSKHMWIKMWLWGTWKGIGWGSIVYIAAISGIDKEQYEAAEVDGAGRFAKMWYVTVPCLIPTFFVLLIMSIGNIISVGMEQPYVFQNPMNKKYIEVLDLYVYNQGIVGVNYSYSTAVGIMKSLVSVILFFAANTFSKLVREESVF